VSNEGKNENVNQGQINYDLDLDAPKEQKPVARPKTVELTIVKRAREQATKQQKDVQETLNERLRTSGAFAAVVKANSVQGSLAKALGFQSNINQVIKSVGVAFQATQPAITACSTNGRGSQEYCSDRWSRCLKQCVSLARRSKKCSRH
jgi:hypothetical protein